MRTKDVKKWLIDNDKIPILLDSIGMHSIGTSHSNYISCAFPDGDNTTACIIYIDTDYLTTNSYTRNIQSKEFPDKRTDIIDLVAFVKNISTSSAKSWIESQFGLTDKTTYTKNDTSFFGKFKKKLNVKNRCIMTNQF